MDVQADMIKLIVANALRNANIGDMLLPLAPKTEEHATRCLETFGGGAVQNWCN